MKDDGISTVHKQGFWPRCSGVTITDGQVHCSLDFDRQYDLVTWSRRYSAHTRFLQLKTERELCTFVRAWGPLDIVAGTSSLRVEAYRAFQRRLRALANLLISSGDGHLDGRECLSEYCAADEADHALSPLSAFEISPTSQFVLQSFIRGANVSDWIRRASRSQVQEAVAHVLQSEFSDRVFLAVEYDGSQFQIAPRWNIEFFRDAMRWLVWNDRIAFCPECKELFKLTSHRWKFCKDECAKKATDREWRREDRRKRKLQRKATKPERKADICLS